MLNFSKRAVGFNDNAWQIWIDDFKVNGVLDIPARLLGDYEFSGMALVGPTSVELDGPTEHSGVSLQIVPLNREAKDNSSTQLRQNYESATIRQSYVIPGIYAPVKYATVVLRTEYMVALKRHEFGDCTVKVYGSMIGSQGVVIESSKTMQVNVDVDDFGAWFKKVVTSICMVAFYGKPKEFNIHQDVVFRETKFTPSSEIRQNFSAFSYWVRAEIGVIFNALQPETSLWVDCSDSEAEDFFDDELSSIVELSSVGSTCNSGD